MDERIAPISCCSQFFPCSPDLDPSMSITCSIPEVIISTYVEKKCKCGAYLLPQELFCPICNPEKFFLRRQKTFFDIYQISSNNGNPPRSILLLIDLDIPSDDLGKLVKLLITNLSLPENSEIADMMFFTAFIGNSVSMIRHKESELTFSSIDCIGDLMRFACQFSFLSTYLEVATTQAKKYFLPTSDKKVQLQKLFTLFKNTQHLSDIQDIFYFFSEDLPNKFRFDPLPNLHLIQLSQTLSKANIQFALHTNATFSLQTVIDQSTFNYFKKCIILSRIPKPTVSIQLSEGLYVQPNDIHGPVVNVKTLDQKLHINMKYYYESIPLSFILRSKQSSLENKSYFSIQIQLNYFYKTLIIMNEVWSKSTSTDEWFEHLNFPYFCCSKFQKKAQKILNNYSVSLPWTIPNWKFHIPKNHLNEYKLFEKFLFFILVKDKTILDSQKFHILLSIFYGNVEYFQHLYSAIMRDQLNTLYIVLPPYVFFNDKDEDNIENIKSKYKSVDQNLTFSFLEESKFNNLLFKISDLRSKMRGTVI